MSRGCSGALMGLMDLMGYDGFACRTACAVFVEWVKFESGSSVFKNAGGMRDF